MITIKSTEEVGKMRKAGALLHQVHEHLKTLIEPGVTTAYLDQVAEKLIARLSGRRVCPKCGGTYHITKLADEKVCPDCGGELIQRDDDNPATIANRLSVYHAQTSPLTEFYSAKGILKQVDGALQMEEVTSQILNALAE